MKPLIMQRSPTSCHFVSFRSKCSQIPLVYVPTLMLESIFRTLDSCVAAQEFPILSWNPKCYYHDRKTYTGSYPE
jgi:hypothetical protein